MIEKKPFIKYNLDSEEKDEGAGEVFSVRLNKDERAWLNEVKKELHIVQDGRALKVAAFVGMNVLHGTFGADILGYLFKKDRVRPGDVERLE
jgi:hypothetical protein